MVGLESSEGRRTRHGRAGAWRVRGLQLFTLAGLLTLWELAARAAWVDPMFVPAPSGVARAFGNVGATALRGLADTLLKTLIAYLLSVALGVTLGIVLGSAGRLRDAVNPFVIALYGMPKILVLPWIVLIFGFGVLPSIVYGTVHGTFPILLLVMGGVRDVDRSLIAVARSLGATRWQLYRKVILPGVVPSVVAGMRVGIVFCLLGVLVVEMFAGIRGMGYVLGTLANGFDAAGLFAATALVSVASIAIVLSLDVLNDRLSRWRG